MNHFRSLSDWHEAPARFTADEFMEFVEGPPFSNWVGKVELVEGVIVRMSPAYIPHWNAQRILFGLIEDAFGRGSREWIVGPQPTVRLSDDTVREPDIAVLRSMAWLEISSMRLRCFSRSRFPTAVWRSI